MAELELPAPAPPDDVLRDDVIEPRLRRVLGPADAASRPAELRFLAVSPECRLTIHRRAAGVRVGRIHLRLTADPTVVRAFGHCGYEVDPAHRRSGYAGRALLAMRRSTCSSRRTMWRRDGRPSGRDAVHVAAALAA